MLITVLILSLIFLLFAFLIAKYYEREGYFFWRTFIMSIMMFIGLFLLIFNALK